MNFTSRILKVFTPFVLGYFITTYFRTVCSVFSPLIENSTQISTHMMGTVTSLYFLAFALMQIPTGVLCDHYGPRRTQSGLFFIVGIGSILFGLASGPALLVVGRALMGLGLGGGLMIAFTANRLFFNKGELPMLNSLTFSLGSLGTVGSSLPTEALLRTFSWSTISIAMGMITLAIAVIILIFVPDLKKNPHQTTLKDQISGLKVIFSERYFWKIAPMITLSLGALLSMQSFWISPWLRESINADSKTISLFLLAIGVATIFTVPVASFFSLLFSKFKGQMEWIAAIGAALSVLTQIFIVSKVWPGSYILWILFGFFSFFPMIGYTSISLHFPSKYSTRATTGLNLLTFTGAFFLQYLFGVIGAISLVAAFWTYIILQICSIIWFCFGEVGRYA